jgi:hypothetical protein
MFHTRLDTLQSIDIASPAIAPRIYYGIAYPSDIINVSALSSTPSPSRPGVYLRLTPASKWAVRLIPESSLETRAVQIAYLSARDGWSCFYCGRDIDFSTATVEHIVPVAHDGPTHASNLCLACGNCNAMMGHLPGVQKMKLAVSARIGTIASTVLVNQKSLSLKSPTIQTSKKRRVSK